MLLQERLEKIWISLKMPEALRVDMAMKYSSKQEIEDITEVIIFTFLPHHRFPSQYFSPILCISWYWVWILRNYGKTQTAFTSSKLTIEALEQGVKYV